MKADFAKYTIPGLAVLCAAAALPVVSGMRATVEFEPEEADSAPRELRLPEELVIKEDIPSMTEVLAKHLFVADRKPTGQNSYPDLMIKGVYIGDQCNAVFSLKSKPQINFRVWQGDEDAAFKQVEDERDPRRPIVDFLQEWEIKEVGMKDVTLEHLLTGETETYTVNYTPVKKVADSAGAGYGQGLLVDNTPKAQKKTTVKVTATAKKPTTSSGSGMGGFMRQMTPEQRAMFIQKMRERMGAGSIGNGSGGGDKSVKKSEKKSYGGGNGGNSKKSAKKSKKKNR